MDILPICRNECFLVIVQQPGLNVITELVIGYLYPGRPLANVAFKTYGYISMVQAINFLGDFKLGHYMKVPPRSMFVAQVSIILNFPFSVKVFCILFWMKVQNNFLDKPIRSLKNSLSPYHFVVV